VHCILCFPIHLVNRNVCEIGATSEGGVRSEQVTQQNRGDSETSNNRNFGNERRVCIKAHI
jgi:hypothetical protein